MIPLTNKDINRFYSRIELGPACWLWTGETNNHGYGRLAVYRGNARFRVLTHRLALLLATGEEPPTVRHKCDTPLCNRPAHLEPGSQLQNIHDALRRGRMNLGGLAEWRAERTRVAQRRIEAGVKRCPRCGETKPVTSFHHNASAADGRQGHCAACRRLAAARGRPAVAA